MLNGSFHLLVLRFLDFILIYVKYIVHIFLFLKDYLAWWLGVCSFKAKYLHNPSVGFIRNFLLLIVGESRKHMK